MIADAELLRRYAEETSEEAFAELVRRHLNQVYAAALRQVGDTHRAEDVVQMVFSDLARKASELSRRPVLLSWLYTSTHYAAAKVVRTERRRQAREQEAQTMHELSSPAASEADWNRLRPVLDEAMHDLDENDREAVLLRFFEGKPFAGVGASLGLNEDAARKRVERALDRLHGALTRRGITSTSAALAAMLAGQPAVAAPAGLAAATTAGALAAGYHTVAFFQLMSMTKLKIVIVGAVLVAGTAGLVLQRQDNARLRAENSRLQQSGEETAALRAENSRLVRAAGDATDRQAEHAEPVQPRDDAVARKRETPAAGGGIAPSVGKTSAPSGLVRIDAMQNQGRTTPRATGQTVAWAMHHGDVDVAAGLITFEPESRAKLEALVTTLPANLRAEYGTPERLMAFVMAGTPRPIAALQVLDEAEQGPDDFSQHLQLQYEDGLTRVDNVRFHRTADGWQQVISPAVVDRVVHYLNSGSLPPAVTKR